MIWLNCHNYTDFGVCVGIFILGNLLQATNAAPDYCESTDLVSTLHRPLHLLQIFPTHKYPVGYACSDLLVWQLSPWEPYWSSRVWETDRV